ncbi:MAG: efflux RND transporter periplasmic adaptor subunit [Myxococcota bacterium]
MAVLAACHADHEAVHERPSYPVTSPMRTDTETTREYVCQIRAIQHIEVRAMARGFLQQTFVDEGQLVHKGQRMFQIMPMLYRAELQKADAEAQFAEVEYGNTKLLQDKNVVSPNELAMARAKWEKAKAEVSLARTHLAFTEIKAPFDGVMNRLLVRQGSLLDEGELLTTLSDNSQMWVYFNVTEAEYLDYQSHVAANKPAPVKLVMANGKVFEEPGKIETIEADFNNETGNLAFRATFTNPKGLLRHGETGKILMTLPLHDVLIIPQSATFDILDKKFVYTVDDGGIVHAREIAVSVELPHLFVVAEGLDGSEKILLDGLRKVRDGDQIQRTYREPAKVMASLDLPAE